MNKPIDIKVIAEPSQQAVSSPTLLHKVGRAMQNNRRIIQQIQWTVVGVYVLLLIAPLFFSLPRDYAHIYENAILFTQFIFWGIWWPFVLISMMLMGRVWCGVFCPEGTLTEWTSRYGLGKAIPRWMQWQGWPFVAFALTTIYGQLISVYEYPKAVLIILGGSTVAAMIVGFIYGKGKRVWCRYLCPVNGVFGLLSRLAPVHFAVNEKTWQQSLRPTEAADCPTLLNVRKLESNQKCHMCGRCNDYRGAISVEKRSFNTEITNLTQQDVSRWEVALIVYGLLGIAVGAFQWSSSPLFIQLHQFMATWLIQHQVEWPLMTNAPWWLLTHHPEVNDSFSWLDGGIILTYILSTALIIGSLIMLLLYVSAQILGNKRHLWLLAYGLIPTAGLSTFLGLFSLTISMLRAEYIDMSWVAPLRIMILLGAFFWSARLFWVIIRKIAFNAENLGEKSTNLLTRSAACLVACCASASVLGLWGLVFFVW